MGRTFLGIGNSFIYLFKHENELLDLSYMHLFTKFEVLTMKMAKESLN